ncbi:hypothetical protein TNCV_2476931 [Trichonephila clavipes]|nr:hypothetical protein TNCV_2476931 [Trichonephila clavipes]
MGDGYIRVPSSNPLGKSLDYQFPFIYSKSFLKRNRDIKIKSAMYSESFLASNEEKKGEHCEINLIATDQNIRPGNSDKLKRCTWVVAGVDHLSPPLLRRTLFVFRVRLVLQSAYLVRWFLRYPTTIGTVIAKEDFLQSFLNMYSRSQRCIVLGGDYLEGQLNGRSYIPRRQCQDICPKTDRPEDCHKFAAKSPE